MEQQQINQTLMYFADKLPSESLPMVSKRLAESNITQEDVMVMSTRMKDPTIALILSILIGYLGVDRFYIGDTGMGIGKLLTCGGLYIWWIVDIFLIMKATKQKNLQLLMIATNERSNVYNRFPN